MIEKNLTFLLFSRNDCPEEQLRTTLCLESLIDQDIDCHCIIFADASENGKELQVPKSGILEVIRMPTSIGNDFFPAYFRNILALKAITPKICHVNADCVYARNFASTVLKNLEGQERLLILCERRNTTLEQVSKIHTLQEARDFLSRYNEKGGEHASGECQGISRKTFIEIGGYYNLIKKGEVIKGDWSQNAWGEDTYLREGGSNMGIGEKWITDETRFLHLCHHQRKNAKIWCKEH